MILSDRDIAAKLKAGDLVIDPLSAEQVQPASVDLTFSDKVFRFSTVNTYPETDHVIDAVNRTGADGHLDFDGAECGVFRLWPGEFVLASTAEYVEIPPDLAAELAGKSSIGRLGLFTENAGFIDPGFKGNITLELYCVAPRPIDIRVGMRICQMKLTRLTSPSERPYGTPGLGSRYQGQTGATRARA